MKALTFGALTEETLLRIGFAGETGTIRDMAQSVLRASHEERVVARDYAFMRPTQPRTLSIIAGRRTYPLAADFRSLIWLRDRTTGNPYEETRSSMQMEEGRPLATSRQSNLVEFELRGVTNITAQPPTLAGFTVTATSSDAADNGNTVTLEGLDLNGAALSETLTLPNAGASVFLEVLNIIKHGETWAGTLTVTASDATVMASMAADSYGTFVRSLSFVDLPSVDSTAEYDYWRLPNDLEDNTDIPNIPAPFSRIMVYDACLAMTGQSRATQAEMANWKDKQQELQHSMDAAFDEAQSNSAGADYIHYNPR